MSTASVMSMAVGGILGDLIGIRAVYLAAAAIVLLAAGISVILFRGGVRRPAADAAPEMPAAA